MNKLKNIPRSYWINKMKTQKTEDMSKKFLLEFFKDCKIEDKNGLLTISEVPSEFEKFVGKKAPYKFVFDINTHNKIKDSELIMQGSYFLLAIRDYLSDKGQTCLLKINIPSNSLEIEKNSKIKNSKVLEIRQCGVDYLYEFSFLSKYQYLNDKKQSTSKMLLKDKEILDIDFGKYKLHKGNKEEIPSINLSEQYQFAKKKLNEKVAKEIKPIKLLLKAKLEKELDRIKNHYHKQIKEKDEEVEACANKIKLLNSKLRHTSYERDRNIIMRMIRESEDRLEMLKQRTFKERLREEELFHINDEVEKHVLAIKNGLINITVYYYPIFEIDISSKGKKSTIKYDPVIDKII